MRIMLSIAAMLLILQATPAISQEEESKGNLETTKKAIDSGWKQTKEFWSDASITKRVKTRFLRDDKISGFAVKVVTNDRIVTLSGDLQSEELAQRAMDIAGSTEGVTDVTNNMYIVIKEKSTAK